MQNLKDVDLFYFAKKNETKELYESVHGESYDSGLPSTYYVIVQGKDNVDINQEDHSVVAAVTPKKDGSDRSFASLFALSPTLLHCCQSFIELYDALEKEGKFDDSHQKYLSVIEEAKKTIRLIDKGL